MTALIAWDPSMSVGHLPLDRDHRVLIEDINKMHSGLAAGKDKQVLKGMLATLVNDAEAHFRREETVWKSSGYGHFDEHRQQHAALLYAMRTFRTEYEKSTALLSLGGINLLVLWLMHHILESDRPAAAAIGLVDAPSIDTFDWSLVEKAGRAYGLDLVPPAISTLT